MPKYVYAIEGKLCVLLRDAPYDRSLAHSDERCVLMNNNLLTIGYDVPREYFYIVDASNNIWRRRNGVDIELGEILAFDRKSVEGKHTFHQ